MPRNSSGTYTLPNPSFVSNTVISSSVFNGDNSDIVTALTQSMATTGVSTMTGQFKGYSGTAASPTIQFGSSPTTGFYSSGANEVSVAINGVQALKINGSSMTMLPGYNIIDRLANAIYAFPIGLVSPYSLATAPTLWLLCGGQAVSRTTYAALFAIIGTTYGVGDGSTTFNVPDLRGRAPYGKDDMAGTPANRITLAGSGIIGTTLGASGGTQNVTIAQANLPNSSATVTDPTHTHVPTGGALAAGSAEGPGSTGTGTPTVNLNSTGVTVGLNGSGTALASMNPTLVTGYIIYAGV